MSATIPSERTTPAHGVLFDVGYTLMDESRRLAHAIDWWCQALRRDGTELSRDRLEAAYRATAADPDPAEPSLMVQAGVTLGLPRDVARAYRRRMPWDARPMDPYPDAADALRRLRQAGVRVGVLANQPASARDDLERVGLAPLCDGIWLSEAAGLSKPDPAFFRLALDAWAMPPSRVAYVGDRPDNDVAPARRLGLYTVRLRRGPHAPQPARHDDEHAHADAHTLDDAVDRLLDWARRSP